MSLFLSTFTNKIDSKGRVSLPASFRTSLMQPSQEGFVLFKSYTHPALEGCSYQRMKQLSDSMDTLDLFSEVQDNLAATIFADATYLSWDRKAAFLFPKIFSATRMCPIKLPLWAEARCSNSGILMPSKRIRKRPGRISKQMG